MSGRIEADTVRAVRSMNAAERALAIARDDIPPPATTTRRGTYAMRSGPPSAACAATAAAIYTALVTDLRSCRPDAVSPTMLGPPTEPIRLDPRGGG